MVSGKSGKWMRKITVAVLALVLVIGLAACGSGSSDKSSSASSSGKSSKSGKVTIYCNSDDEAVDVMKKTLDDNGFKGKYVFQTFGTSELGGKMLAEGKNIDADLLCMSSFYIDSAQQKDKMFAKLSIDKTPLKEYGDYYRPMLANQGAIFYNTKEVKADKLDVPKSLKDLTKSEYKDKISVPDISGSSTAWLMIQALISEYGEKETKSILKKMYQNAGNNLEDSGSGPIKKVLAGEAAIGFGLRHQAVMDKQNGEPIDYVDPTEGDFTLTEGVAVVDHDSSSAKQKLAQQIAACIIEKGRKGLQKYYPIALYKGETTDKSQISKNTKEFKEPLTAELLQKHTKLSEECK